MRPQEQTLIEETALAQEAPAADPSEQDKQRVVSEFFNKKTEALPDAPKEAAEDPDAEAEVEAEAPKKEKTAEAREIERLRRAMDKRTKALYETRAQLSQQKQLLSEQNESKNLSIQGNDENVTLSRAELQQLITREAAKAAPAIQQQQAEIEHRRAVVASLEKSWGQEKFDAYSSDLDDAFGGFYGPDGLPKPAADAIFEADAPAALIEYLADPDNAAEAATLAAMQPTQAGRAIARLEAKLETAKTTQTQRSNAPEPIEKTRGMGTVNAMPNPANTKAYIKWANEQEAASKR